jgi:hypothetical protein
MGDPRQRMLWQFLPVSPRPGVRGTLKPPPAVAWQAFCLRDHVGRTEP